MLPLQVFIPIYIPRGTSYIIPEQKYFSKKWALYFQYDDVGHTWE
jgi:hypothetical protein